MKGFKTLCEEIYKWQQETFKSSDSFSKWHHLKEEIIELHDALKSGDSNGIRKELADCFILLIGIAMLHNVYPDDIIKEKFEIVKKRKWGKPDKYGVVRHINKGGK